MTATATAAAAAAAVGVVGVAGAAGGVGPAITLRVDGPSGTAFSGECTLVAADGDRSIHTVDGATPLSRSFVGRSLSCRIRHDGASGGLSVEIVKASDRGYAVSRSSASPGGIITVTVR